MTVRILLTKTAANCDATDLGCRKQRSETSQWRAWTFKSAREWRYVFGRVFLDVSNDTCVFIFRDKQCKKTVDFHRTQLRNDKLMNHKCTASRIQVLKTVTLISQPENLLLHSQISPHGLSLSQPKLHCLPSHPFTWSTVSALSSHPVVVFINKLHVQKISHCCIHSTPQYSQTCLIPTYIIRIPE